MKKTTPSDATGARLSASRSLWLLPQPFDFQRSHGWLYVRPAPIQKAGARHVDKRTLEEKYPRPPDALFDALGAFRGTAPSIVLFDQRSEYEPDGFRHWYGVPSLDVRCLNSRSAPTSTTLPSSPCFAFLRASSREHLDAWLVRLIEHFATAPHKAVIWLDIDPAMLPAAKEVLDDLQNRSRVLLTLELPAIFIDGGVNRDNDEIREAEDNQARAGDSAT
jgi:hypothetical protein